MTYDPNASSGKGGQLPEGGAENRGEGISQPSPKQIQQDNYDNHPENVSGKHTRSENNTEQTTTQDESMLTHFAEPATEQPVQDAVLEQDAKLKISNELEKDLVQVFKLLADETRLKILFLLGREKELHVSALCERLGQSQPAVSHHLALLRVAGLIEPRRDGKHNFYSIQQNRFHDIMGELFTTFADDSNSEFRFENFIFRQDGSE